MMAKYDILDEAIIDAEPAVVYNALIEETEGKTNWWMPYVSLTMRSGDSADQVGAVFEITVNRKPPAKFIARVVEVKKDELMRCQFIEGAVRGEGLWKLEPKDGKTKLSYRWRASPAGLLLRILAPLINMPKGHSDVMQACFKQLNEHLKRRS
jgi:hypothetical protein